MDIVKLKPELAPLLDAVQALPVQTAKYMNELEVALALEEIVKVLSLVNRDVPYIYLYDADVMDTGEPSDYCSRALGKDDAS
jgi:hypothetical protein